MEPIEADKTVDTSVFVSNMWPNFLLTVLMHLSTGDLSSCNSRCDAAQTLIKLLLIKVSLILLARLIDLICLSSTIGCDLYLVNELIDLARVYLEESKRILTCCPF